MSSLHNVFTLPHDPCERAGAPAYRSPAPKARLRPAGAPSPQGAKVQRRSTNGADTIAMPEDSTTKKCTAERENLTS